jgi:hypothetical protein
MTAELTGQMMTTITDPLVSTDWLAARLNDPTIKILDASFKLPGVLPLPKDDYLAAHIPGAAFFDVDAISDHGVALPHMFQAASPMASARSASPMPTQWSSMMVAVGSPVRGRGGCFSPSAMPMCACSMAACRNGAPKAAR